MSESSPPNKRRRRDHSDNRIHPETMQKLDVGTYLNKVQATLQNHNKYRMFCRIMIDFKDGFNADRVDFVGLTTSVKELFRGHDNLILGFNDFLPKKHKIILDDTVRFQEAVDFVNNVHLRFHHKEHIYKTFLDVLNLCLQGHKRVDDDVYCKVAALFKDHHDLLKEFKRLVSIEGFGVVSCDDEKEKTSNKKYNRGLDLCRKVQNKLCNSDDYQNFLKSLHYYSTGVISRRDLQRLVADVLQKDSGLVEEFNSFLKCCEKIDGLFSAGVVSDGYQSKSSKEKRHVAESIQELDLIQCEDCTPSYWFLPEEYQIPLASQRSKLDAQVLNDRYVSRGKDCSSKPSHKDKHEKFMFKCEDVRFELDMLLNSVSSAAARGEYVLKSMKRNNITLDTPFDIKKHFTALNIQCIKRLYGEHGLDVLNSLRRNPAVALPLMLTHLKQKQEELTRRRSDLNEFWAEVYAKIRQQNSKRLSIEALERMVQNIEERMQRWKRCSFCY